MATLSKVSEKDGRSMRLAIEGCGHGTLDAIYASVWKACELKGWDGIDLLIICGDFHAVRDQLDLNVTAMPAKYRQMADFHHYYWGSKCAPFLTIFIGGNHEASNHLFELYYGGWVAPNIYYLGAANVVQIGPLKIAGLSGIWKGYDYRKPHFERLPYNEEDIQSIYHVRELDVRKLLAFRSQVDIGLSHDWPQGIEWLGDHARLFKHKPFLEGDAVSGKLGSVAANQVLGHLRPPYWFSAHLHTKYSALKKYDGGPEAETKAVPTYAENQRNVSAWKNFSDTVRASEAAETEQLIQQQAIHREESQRSGLPLIAGYAFEETHKKVKLGDNFARIITNVSGAEHTTDGQEQPNGIPQLDGCCASIPSKRPHESSVSQKAPITSTMSAQYSAVRGLPDITEQAALTAPTAIAANPDAIDIDMSDDDSDTAVDPSTKSKSGGESAPLLGKDNYINTPVKKSDESDARVRSGVFDAATDVSSSTMYSKSVSSIHPTIAQADNNDSVLPPMPNLEIPDRSHSLQELPERMNGVSTTDSNVEEQHTQHSASADMNGNANSEDVPDDVRAQLAALSSTFADKFKPTPALPHPEDIANKQTQFLALSKCESGQHFLQLMEVSSLNQAQEAMKKPYKIQYVPEWLAILRVFAPELYIGQDSRKKSVPPHRGDTYYREQILEEEKWVMENIVKPGLLEVPDNFTLTKSRLDPGAATEGRMPTEVTNPQTVEFCKLIDIENPFHEEDAVRQAREAQGPPPTGDSFNQFSNRGKGGRSRGSHRGRGHGGNRGRGSGRGRGHGNRGY